MESHLKNKLRELENNENDAHSVIMQLNETMGCCAESCGLTEKLRKNDRYFDLDFNLMKGEVKYLLNHLNECESTEDQSLRLAKYEDKRREYIGLIKKEKRVWE